MRSTLWKGFCKFAKKHPDTVTASVAVIIAVVSLYVAVAQVKETRKQTAIMNHQLEASRISIRPQIVFQLIGASINAEEYGIYIKNAGLGPAIIREIKFIVKGKSYDATEINSFHKALSAMGYPPSFFSILDSKIHCTFFSKNTYLEPCDFKPYLVMKKNVIGIDDMNDAWKFPKVLHELIIIFEYESLFGDKFTQSYKFSKF